MVKFAGSIPAESVVLVHANIERPKEPVKSTSIQHLEVHVKKLYIIAKADAQLPLQVADTKRRLPEEAAEEGKEDEGRTIVTLNTGLNNRVIDLRATHNGAIFRIKDGVVALFQEFLRPRGFVGVQTPRLLGAASEGESAVVEATRPIFRAENSNTARHLTEFTGLDLEMAFEEYYHEFVSLLEDLMLFIFRWLKERYNAETDLVRSLYYVEDFKLPVEGAVPRLTFPEGIAMLREDGVEIGDFDDLSTPDEKRLGALVLKKYGSDFYALDQYPLAIRLLHHALRRNTSSLSTA